MGDDIDRWIFLVLLALKLSTVDSLHGVSVGKYPSAFRPGVDLFILNRSKK
jgi:hypothetical protein